MMEEKSKYNMTQRDKIYGNIQINTKTLDIIIYVLLAAIVAAAIFCIF